MYLHIGCANRYFDGFINSDMRTEWKGVSHKLDLVMDISKPWPYKDNSVDGIVSMHVLQQLYWRDLIVALKESYRVLKDRGVMRIGVPSIENGKPIEYLLGWNNINLLSFNLLEYVLDKIGFRKIQRYGFRETSVEEFAKIDNRPEQTIFLEAIK
jgi:predicted SAM-dependent methyltransferase